MYTHAFAHKTQSYTHGVAGGFEVYDDFATFRAIPGIFPHHRNLTNYDRNLHMVIRLESAFALNVLMMPYLPKLWLHGRHLASLCF